MIATLPAVQANCRGVRQCACIGDDTIRYYKRTANRRHRRALNRATRRFIHDVELWYDEGFNAPSLSDWELW